MNWMMMAKKDALRAALTLGFILNVVFFPVLWGGKTLMLSSWDVASVMSTGAYHTDQMPTRIGRTPDAGAPAWTIEPWFKMVGDQYWKEHQLPLWNPYAAYGTPLAAAMQAQPFYPLTVLLSLHLTPRTYDFFIIARLFVAGVLMFLFARLFLGFVPSLFAAVTFMLTGYFILYLNMPHLSVEVLLPGLFMATELLLRKNSLGAVAAIAGMVFLGVVGGMPESLFLMVALATLYFLFRLTSAGEFHEQRTVRLWKFFGAVALGFGLGAFLLLPFLEFLSIAHDSHQAANTGGVKVGLSFNQDKRILILYLLPLMFGPVYGLIFGDFSAWTGIRGYWGIVPCIFAGAAVLCCLTPKRGAYPSSLQALTLFFAVVLTLIVLKEFGHPLINWIGGLPVANLIVYPKYLEPLAAFCVAMLAGLGASFLIERRMDLRYFLGAVLVMLGIVVGLAAVSFTRTLQFKEFAFIYYLSLSWGLLVLMSVLFLLFIKKRALLAWSLLGLVSLELCLNYIVPIFYVFSSLPLAKNNPYAGAPYLDFLRTENRDGYRIFARQKLLYPNWAGAFQLADVRSLDALYYRRYLHFIRNFLLKPGDERRGHGDLADRFTGESVSYTYAFDTDLEQRFLALSSVKYLVSASEYGGSGRVLEEVMAQREAEKIWGFGRGTFKVGEINSASGIFQHPPSSQVAYKTVIDPEQPIFQGIAVIHSDAQDKSDGVGFLLEIKYGEKIERLFSTFLNPREVPADKGGRPFRVDLTPYAGQTVELLFSTDPGPNGSNNYDWGGWANPQFVSLKGQPEGPFKQIYNREVEVYELSRILPRACVFRAAEILPDGEVLSRLKDPAFNPETKVLLSRESLPKENPAAIQSLADAHAVPCAAARILRYESQRVQIEAETDGSAVLMLNDANYPGWRVYVNGKSAPLLDADYLFRGVILGPGASTVEFSYEPMSFRIGALISAASLAALAGMGLAYRRRTRRPTARLRPAAQ